MRIPSLPLWGRYREAGERVVKQFGLCRLPLRHGKPYARTPRGEAEAYANPKPPLLGRYREAGERVIYLPAPKFVEKSPNPLAKIGGICYNKKTSYVVGCYALPTGEQLWMR